MIFIFLKKHFYLIVALALTFFALLPLFYPGFFTMHDNEQVGRLYELNSALAQGNIPPRLVPNLGFGYGYPLFNFYPPLVYYLAEIFLLSGFSYLVSTKLMIAMGFLLASLGMYLFAREFLGKEASMVVAVAYTFAPYHSVDVYVRGALPEFWSFVFIPFLFWSFTKLQRKLNLHLVVITGLLIALFTLCHNLLAMMSSLFLGIYLLHLLITTKQKALFTKYILLSGILGALLSAYFWLPALLENKYTMVKLLTTELADYHQHFVYLRQFWNSPWGYGGSIYGLNDGMSFQIGKVHILLFLLAFCSQVYLWLKKKTLNIVFLLFLFFLGLSVFMQTFYATPVWNLLWPFWYIQFPWRFLTFTAFFISFLLGFLFNFSKKSFLLSLASIAVSLLLVFYNIRYFHPKEFLKVTDKNYTSQKVLRWQTSIMAFEYTPYGIATKKSSVGTTVINITPQEIARGNYKILSGDIKVKPVLEKLQLRKYQLNAFTKGTFQFNVFSFPGWKILLDGKEVKYNTQNKFKLLTLEIPSGRHLLEARFTRTLPRLIGDSLSFLAWSFVFLYFLFYLFSAIRKRVKMRVEVS